MAINRLTQNHCCLCGRDRDKQYFDISPIAGNFYPYCNTCLNTKYKQYITITGSEEAALWLTCALLEIPVIKNVLNVAKETTNQKKIGLLKAYFEALKNSDLKPLGFFESDIMLDDLVDIRQANDNEDVDESSEDIRHERELTWGKFSDKEEYELLEQIYSEYTTDLVGMEVGQIRRFRDLCKAELRKMKADESGDKADIESAQKSIKELMAMLKIDKFEDNTKSEIEKFIERKAWMIENTKPAECEDLEKYKDFSGFGKTWDGIMRCVKNLVAGTREYPEVPKDER